MNITIYFLFSFICSALATRIIMPWLLRLCYKKNLFDQPGERKVHSARIPRLGGVVFVPATALGLVVSLCMIISNNELIETFHFSTLVIGMGMLIIYMIGMLDDLFGLTANLKFIVQFVAALSFPLAGLYFNNLHGFCGIWELTPLVGKAFTVFIVMFIVNSINTIDGIDGLCSSLCCIGLAVYTYYFYSIENNVFCLFTCALLGTLSVFMYYNLFGNTQKGRKTFMGDSGSLMLGFSLCYLGLKLSMTNTNIAPPEEGILIPFTIVIIPTFDLIRVATNRVLRGVHPFSPDKTHIHHLLLGLGMTQHHALITLLLSDVILICINFGLWNIGVEMTWIVLVDILLFAVCVEILRYKMPKDFYIPSQGSTVINNQQTKRSSHKNSSNKIKATAITQRINRDRPLISIIVATFNSAKTLRDTLNSIYNQTYQEYEVVLQDGASTDETLSIVEEYKGKFGTRLSVISEKDGGLYDAMNRAIDRATGDIVGILNSDDFYTSNQVLERIAQEFKKNALLEAVYGDIHFVNPDDLNKCVRYYSSSVFRPRYMRIGLMPAHPSFYCLRSLYVKYGKFDTRFKVAADFDQLFRLIYMNRIRAFYIPMDFVTMRTGGASTSGIKSHLQIMQDHLESIRSQGVYANRWILSTRYIYKVYEIAKSKLTI